MRYTVVSGVLTKCSAFRDERRERKLICLIFRTWQRAIVHHLTVLEKVLVFLGV